MDSKKNTDIKLSVVMSTHSMNLNWLKLSIESILKQSFSEFEFIIVIDSPYDIHLKNFLNEYRMRDERIKLILNKRTYGFPKSINKAIKKSKGEYIARMDSDDISEVNRLFLQYEFMEKNKNISICGTNARIINSEGNIVGNFIRPSNETAIEKYIYHQNPLIHPTYLVRTEVYRKLNYYKDITPGQDYEFLARAFLANYKIANLNFYGLRYRTGHKSLSTKYETAFKQLLIASEIRKKLNKGIKYHIKIKNDSGNKLLNIYFQNLYSIQLHFLLKLKRSINFFRIFNIFIILLVTMMHPLLVKDMYHTIIAKFINLKNS